MGSNKNENTEKKEIIDIDEDKYKIDKILSILSASLTSNDEIALIE